MTKRLQDRLALITGATRGIGRAVALRFAEEGAHVIALGRTQGALEELDDEIKARGGEATLIPLDLAKNPDGIDYIAEQIGQRWGRLDVLVGNAAILGPMAPLAHIGGKEWDKLIATNVLPNVRLLKAFDTLLRRAKDARVIMVTSTAAQKNEPFWGGYGATKAMLDYVVRTYQAECEGSQIKINSINPGGTRTAMRAQAKPAEDPLSIPAPEDITESFVICAEPACPFEGQIINARDYLSA